MYDIYDRTCFIKHETPWPKERRRLSYNDNSFKHVCQLVVVLRNEASPDVELSRGHFSLLQLGENNGKIDTSLHSLKPLRLSHFGFP